MPGFSHPGSLNELFDASHNTALQTDLDTMGMYRGFCENILDDPFGELPGPLILLLNDPDMRPRSDIFAAYCIHSFVLDLSPYRSLF